MLASELSEEKLLKYLKIEEDEAGELDDELDIMVTAAKEYLVNQTGVPAERLFQHHDVTIALCVLVQDMLDNRRMYVDNQNVNRVVESIIYQYSENLV